MSAVKTLRRRFTVGRYRATLSVQLAAGVPAGVKIEWDRDHPPRLSSADLARYRRLRNAILQSVADELHGAVIDYAKKVGDWPALDKAVDLKIDEIQDFVAFWDAAVSVRHGMNRHTVEVHDQGCLSVDDAENETGITKQQVSKWRKAMATPESLEKFRQKTRLAGYKSAGLVDGSSETLATKFTGDPEGYTPARYIEAAVKAAQWLNEVRP